tara:strand:- start:438 stop:653 length:216 start_codon:yes stop_codon:yes gene_type:complete
LDNLPNSALLAPLNTISFPPESNLKSSIVAIVKSPLPLSVNVAALLPSLVIDNAPVTVTPLLVVLNFLLPL